MADDSKKGFGPWSRVPHWDGSPQTWRRFKRDVSWWVSSLDLASTTKYNLAARFLLRQDGVARQRGEEFSPDELQYEPAEVVVDPETDERIELRPINYLAGVERLMQAWEAMTGHTDLDKRGDLRQQFYVDLQRKPNERVAEFATRFRSLVADLRAEGVQLHDNELGWWLKHKLGLDALRRQLLETALGGSEDYQLIEREVLRLFRDLHDNDPLRRRFDQPKLTVRRLFQHNRAPVSSTAAASSIRSNASTVSRPSTFRSSVSRQAHVTETVDEEVPEEPADMEAADEQGEAGAQLEEVLQAEAEILATELEAAEEEGIDPSLIQEFETGIESAAETLVTMREARQTLANVRKDRGYQKTGADGGKGGRKGQAQSRKQSGRHPCFDCGGTGHWAGDAECPTPGAGAAKKAGAKKVAKQVRITESENVANVTESMPSSLPMHDVLVVEEPPLDHDVLMVDRTPLSLEQALAENMARSTLIASRDTELPPDKELIGALDSACNSRVYGVGQVGSSTAFEGRSEEVEPFASWGLPSFARPRGIPHGLDRKSVV